MTLDIEKAFDSVNYLFLIAALEKYGFKEDFIKWIEILIKNQGSCVINGGATTNYLKLGKGARQGDPIFAYILVLEIAFSLSCKIKTLLFIYTKALLFLKKHFSTQRMQIIELR